MTIIGIAGTVICLLLYVLFASLPEGNQTEEISLRGDQKEGYTIDDMINNVKGDNSAAQRRMPMPNPEAPEEDEDLERIKQLIRENREDFEDTPPAPAPAPKPRKEKKPEQAEEDTDSVVAVKTPARRGFNSIKLVKEDEGNAIKAFVHSTQTVMVGATLKMQLAENCLTDDGQRVRKGTPVYGEVTSIDGERVIVKITSININNSILPFKKNVYSRDAIEGIYVPGNPKSDVAKDASASAISGTNANITGGFDIGSQLVAGAANSVVSATKSATSRNIRKIKVTIKTNYQILLMEDKK